MHFDLRLELEGVLKSWAVPKGPSVRAEEKRLAVHVEDHPLEYANFEGVIPAGNYGAGSVIVWDRGTYGSFKPEDIREQYARGKLELELFGHKLGGRWTLVRMSKSEKDWLLLKKADGAASDQDALERWPRSVISGLTVQEMRDVPGWLAELRAHVAALKAPRGDLRADQVQHMLATLAEEPFSRPGWVFEIKYDGVRVIAERRGEDVRMLGRSGEDITARYPEIAAALRGLVAEQFVLDGEIVAYDASGQPELRPPAEAHAALAPARHRRRHGAGPGARGVLRLPGARGPRPAQARAARSQGVPRPHPAAGRESSRPAITSRSMARRSSRPPPRWGSRAMIAKRADSRYTGKRSADWVKIKCQRRQEFVIGGYTEPRGSGRHFGALHVGVYEDGQLRHVTRVGSGFDGATQDQLWKQLQPLAPRGVAVRRVRARGARRPLGGAAARVRGALHRVDRRRRAPPPDLHGAAHRPEARGCPARGRGGGASGPEADGGRCRGSVGARRRARRAHSRRRHRPREPREVRLSNLRKVFWPDEGYTKGDLIAYYDAVAPLMLRYLRDRPVVLTRYPDGIKGKSFFQKDAPVFVPGLDAHRDGLLQGLRARHPLLRARRRGVAALRRQPRHDPDPHVERSVGLARAARLAGARPRPQGRAVRARGRGGAEPAPAARRAGAAELPEDVGRRRGSTS